jgi:hypothetical protein
LLLKWIVDDAENFTRLLGAMQSTSCAICVERPRTIAVEHDVETAVLTEIADTV